MATAILKGTGATVTRTKRVPGVYVDRQEYNDHKNSMFSFMGGILLFVVITFVVEITSMHRNYAQDKALALQNNQLNKDYFEKILELQREVDELRTDSAVLRAKNSFLK
jgi:hypothetical protein